MMTTGNLSKTRRAGLRHLSITTILSIFAVFATAHGFSPASAASTGLECGEPLSCPPVCNCSLDRSCAPRDNDQVWLISTRCLHCCDASAASDPDLRVRRFESEDGWRDSSGGEFLAGDAPSGAAPPLTVIFVHGNRVDSGSAKSRGWAVYHRLAEQLADDVPLRFVMFSWPSTQIRGQIRDVRVKASRSDTDAYFLGWLLSRMDSRGPVSLLGFSYGARIISGALHLLGGGSVAGNSLDAAVEGADAPAMRAVFFAAAAHSWWLEPGEKHGLALLQLESLLLLNNSCDMALKRYRLVDKCSRPEALGYTGFYGSVSFGDNAARIEQHDVCCTIGKEHALDAYLCSDCLMRRVGRELLRLPPQ